MKTIEITRIESLWGSPNRIARILATQLLRSAESEKMIEDGTLLIGVGGVLPEKAHFHKIYGPACPADIEALEHQVGLPLPKKYKDFLLEINGARCFAGDYGICHLALHGVLSRERGPGASKLVPFDLAVENCYSRLRNLPQDHWVVGSYQCDGSLICMAPLGKIYRRTEGSAVFLNEWTDLESFVDLEFQRLGSLFNSDFSLRSSVLLTTP